jgi:hypothetical protein
MADQIIKVSRCLNNDEMTVRDGSPLGYVSGYLQSDDYNFNKGIGFINSDALHLSYWRIWALLNQKATDLD